ncbi:MAG: shikimate kinase [Alphaproteobacteria bacterium]|nr:shikimate kinase [Alphaproteobacteria bacterium]
MPEVSSFVPDRTIVLVGMMGAGKSSVGRKLASRLSLPFFDSDVEIETAARMSIPQFFEHYGEAEFRKGERRVIARLLDGPLHVLSAGGGSFMDTETRSLIRSRALSIWLKADLDTLVERATRRDNRPLLKGGDPREKMMELMVKRESLYAEADVTVPSDNRPVDETLERILKALSAYAEKAKAAS